MKFVHGQTIHFSLRALYWFGRGVSGDYKRMDRARFVPVSSENPSGEVKCTDEENLAECFERMKRFVGFVGDCVENPEFTGD